MPFEKLDKSNTSIKIKNKHKQRQKTMEGVYNLTDVKFRIGNWSLVLGAPMGLNCGYIRNKDIHEYLERLQNFTLPKGHNCDFVLFSKPCNVNGATECERTLLIENKSFQQICPCGNNSLRQCTGMRKARIDRCAKQCYKNIKCGKCKDPFVIENIGKIFFADKYKQDNQR